MLWRRRLFSHFSKSMVPGNGISRTNCSNDVAHQSEILLLPSERCGTETSIECETIEQKLTDTPLGELDGSNTSETRIDPFLTQRSEASDSRVKAPASDPPPWS